MATPETVHQLASNRRGSICHSLCNACGIMDILTGTTPNVMVSNEPRRTPAPTAAQPFTASLTDRKCASRTLLVASVRCAVQPFAQNIGLHIAVKPKLRAQYDRVAVRRWGCRLNQNAAVRQQLHRIAPGGRQPAARRTRRCAQRGHVGRDRRRPAWHDSAGRPLCSTGPAQQNAHCRPGNLADDVEQIMPARDRHIGAVAMDGEQGF